MKPPVRILSLSLAAAALIQSACNKSEPGGGKPSSGAAVTETVGTDGVRTIKLTGGDTMLYNVKEIAATPGEKLNIELTNIGALPKVAMSHNWVLLKPMSDAEISTFAAAASAKPTEFMPDDLSKVITHTNMLGPGEKATLAFTAPTEAGNYPYICTFPGHFALMRGVLIVKAR